MESLRCDSCAYTLQTKQSYENHMRSDRHRLKSQIRNGEITNINSHTCKKCNKIFKFQSSLSRHKQRCSPVQPTPPNVLHTETLAVLEQIKEMLQHQTSPAVAVNNVTNDSPEYIYLLQEREFVKNGQPIYKIGKTKQPNQKRFSQYPKGSVLLFQRICHNCHQVEGQLIQRFKEVFKQHTDIGSEYFEGDSFAMMEHMNAVVTK